MTRSEIKTSLEAVYPQELTDALLTSYEHAIIEYRKSHWQYFGNEIGQFIEVARRIIEYQLSGNYTPLADRLTIFSEKVLISLESHSSTISEVYRVLIPRTLYAMYCLRNKRGMIHKSSIDPNKMDATVLLGNAKWILAEFFRLASTLPFEETEAIIESIICRETSVVWDTGTSLRILDTRMSAKDKVLCLLYVKDMLRDDASYRAIVDALVDFSDDAYVRHTEAVKRIATAYLKLLFPNVRTASDVNPKEFMKYCLRPAIKMRKIIWRQLSILDAEYKNDDKLMPEFTLKEIRNEA